MCGDNNLKKSTLVAFRMKDVSDEGDHEGRTIPILHHERHIELTVLYTGLRTIACHNTDSAAEAELPRYTGGSCYNIAYWVITEYDTDTFP